MSSPFLAEIRMFTCNFAPVGWAICAGQLMAISQNTALFSLLGTNYGGDGKSTFGLPDLQSNAAMHWGQSNTGYQYVVGETSGASTVRLISTEMPAHNHGVAGDTNFGTSGDPANFVYMRGNYDDGQGHTGGIQVYTNVAPDTGLAVTAVGMNGGGLPHNNMMPYLTFTFCIALQGVYPQRS